MMVVFLSFVSLALGNESNDESSWSLMFSEDFEARYIVSNDLLEGFEERESLLNYIEQVNRFGVLASSGAYEIGVQVDQVSLFANRYFMNEELVYENEIVGDNLTSFAPDHYVNIDKVWVTRRSGGSTLQFGDHYASFGRGLALNMVKQTGIDIDTSILGVKTTTRLGDWSVESTIGVTNIQQISQDNRINLLSPDTRHWIVGGRVDAPSIAGANLGLHGVGYQFTSSTADIEPFGTPSEGLDAAVLGATCEVYGLGGWDIYMEGDLFSYLSDDLVVDEESQGLGLYASASKYIGNLTVTLEGKHYLNTERLNTYAGVDNYEFASGPTLEYERVITEDSAAAVNSNDITGGRLRLDLMAGVATPHLEVSVSRDRDLEGLHFNESSETIIHPVAGVDFFSSHVQAIANAGYRVDIRDSHGSDSLIHGDISLDVPVGPWEGEFALDVKAFSWGENSLQQTDFIEESFSLGLGVSDDITLVVYQDYTDNELISSTGNVTDRVYGAGEIQWHTGTSSTLKAFYGAYKAGIRCAGGQCRSLPGFEGARVSYSSVF